ncbi:MAG: hypothetical protein IT303_11225 [Dehalococcoidia bacterium]|nr:hypothetical protein [Dehalococcoidia bacterium]
MITRFSFQHRPIARLALVSTAVMALALLAAACSDDDGEPSTTPTSPQTTSPTATASAATPTSAATTTSPTAAIATYPPETRTGVAAVDAILATVLAGEADEVESRLAYIEVPCTANSSVPGPECPPGVPGGTNVRAFPRTGCESTYERMDVIGPVVSDFLTPELALVAVYRVDPARPGQMAPGAFGLVFAESPAPGGATATMVAVTVDVDGRIVHWAASCNRVSPPDFLEQRPVLDYVLPLR